MPGLDIELGQVEIGRRVGGIDPDGGFKLFSGLRLVSPGRFGGARKVVGEGVGRVVLFNRPRGVQGLLVLILTLRKIIVTG